MKINAISNSARRPTQARLPRPEPTMIWSEKSWLFQFRSVLILHNMAVCNAWPLKHYQPESIPLSNLSVCSRTGQTETSWAEQGKCLNYLHRCLFSKVLNNCQYEMKNKLNFGSWCLRSYAFRWRTDHVENVAPRVECFKYKTSG